MPANAQVFRTYLASYGSDTNPCTVAMPCRLLPAALNAVLDGGEVWILDSANFNAGTVNIAKSVSIVAIPSQLASVLAVGNTPAINVATAGVTVGLRNLMIAKNAGNPGPNGVEVSNAAALSVEDCLFANLGGYGIYVHDTGAVIHVKNTTFRNVLNGAIFAVNGPTVGVERSRFIATGGLIAYGTAASTTTTLNIADSTIEGGYGVDAFTQVASAVSRAFVTRSTIQGNSYALLAETANAGTASVTVSGSSVVGNGNGFYQAGTGSTMRSLGNNNFSGNNATTGTLTPSTLQ
ncbi:MAG TPA: right-handed parallel beta-helix repeat-containing protein [Usitatibacter sp.]|jgi:hypothetical protein|nr:right-handed parallel beta-helix repeat-containing protein [Usitatibacter sp.]